MKISQERKESNLRVTKIELALLEALIPFGIEEEDNTALFELEILEALSRLSSRLTGDLRRAQIETEE